MTETSRTQDRAGRFVPLHEQIYSELRRDIVEGKIGIGQKLPTEEQLCRKFRASRITIRHALNSLTGERFISRSPRRGTFVISRTPVARQPWSLDTLQDIVQLGEHSRLEVLSYQLRPLGAGDAELLRERVAFRLQALRRVRGKAIAFSSILLPRRVGTELDPRDFQSRTIYALLAALGHRIGAVKEQIAACPAPRSVAGHLGCRIGAPLLATERLYLDLRSRPVELARSWYLHDRFSINRQIPVRG